MGHLRKYWQKIPMDREQLDKNFTYSEQYHLSFKRGFKLNRNELIGKNFAYGCSSFHVTTV